MVNITEQANKVLTIVKAKYGLRDKSEAINLVVKEYEVFLEPELSPEYRKELEKISKTKFKAFSGIGDLMKEIEHV